MSSDKASRTPRWIAAYLNRWWPKASAVGFGRRGTDITGTPGIYWEVKTPRDFKPTIYAAQAAKAAGGRLAIVVYVPHGIAEATIENSLAIVPLHRMAELLVDAGYSDSKRERSLTS